MSYDLNNFVLTKQQEREALIAYINATGLTIDGVREADLKELEELAHDISIHQEENISNGEYVQISIDDIVGNDNAEEYKQMSLVEQNTEETYVQPTIEEVFNNNIPSLVVPYFPNSRKRTHINLK